VVRDPYDVLGVARNASANEVHAAWLRLCAIYHPDRYQQAADDVRAEAEQRMYEVNAAYESIKNGRARPSTGQRPDSARAHAEKAGVAPQSSNAPRPTDSPRPEVARTSTSDAATRSRALRIGAAVFVALVTLGLAGGFAYAHARFSTTAKGLDPQPTKVNGVTLTAPVPWSSEIQCHSAIDEKTGRGAALSAQSFFSQQALDGKLTQAQVTAGVEAFRNACSHEATNRIKTAGLIFLFCAALGWSVGAYVYKRMQGRHVALLDPPSAQTPDLSPWIYIMMALFFWALAGLVMVATVTSDGSVGGTILGLLIFAIGSGLLFRSRVLARRPRHATP